MLPRMSLLRSALQHPWTPALALALGWGVGPALPALARGELIGQPYTDLYPAVWGLWWFAGEQPGLPLRCELLGAPAGVPFYYASPLHGWAAWPLLALLPLPVVWNLLLLAARVATVLCAFGAARAWGLAGPGALLAAAVYGCAPFFHGYAVEGIVEGTDGWTLALWVWALARPRPGAQALAFALTVASSWYLGAVACLLAACAGPRAWLGAAGGLGICAPLLAAFGAAFPAREALDPAVRAAMGTTLGLAPPGWTAGLNPFARSSWVGLLAPALALWARPRVPPGLLLGGAVCAGLAFGVGPWFELPVLSALRFPYRLHAGLLVLLAAGAGRAVGTRGWAWLWGPAVALEGLLLSPIEPVLPSAPAALPALYHTLPAGAVLLDAPGPLARPPGEVNPSRARARWLLYGQTAHGRASPWIPDFNSVGVASVDGLDAWRALDPLHSPTPPEALPVPEGVDLIVLRSRELHQGGRPAHALLEAQGWARTRQEEGLWLYERQEAR